MVESVARERELRARLLALETGKNRVRLRK
jgi:hypothetical protein